MGEVLATIGFDLKFFLFNLVNFLIIAWLFYRFFFKKIFKVVEERQALINIGLKDKEKYELLLKVTESKSAEIISDAKRQSNEIIETQKKVAQEEAAKIIQNAQDENQKILASGKKNLEMERLDNQRKIRNDAVEIVVSATKKLARSELNLDDKSAAKDILNQTEIKD